MTPTKNTRIAAAAGIAVALVAAGGAYAASKIHHASPDAHGSGGTFVSAPAGYLRGGHGSGLRGGPGFHHGDGLATAAGYLGLTPQQLITQLQTGKTLAQIADATSGKSASGLIDALAAAEQKEHPNDSATDIRTRVTAFVNGTGFDHGPPPGAAPPQQQQQMQPGTHL